MIKKFITLVLPSALAGGLLFNSVFGQAQPTPAPPPPPAAPAPPAPRAAPAPPAPPSGPSISGVMKGVAESVRQQIAEARKSIADNQSIPKATRDKMIARLDKVNAVVDKRLAKLAKGQIDIADLEAMGSEVEEAMEGIEEEMEELGEALGKDIDVNLGNMDFDFDFDFDDDDLDTIPMSPDLSDDDDDMRDAINDLKDLALDKAQRDQIAKIRTDSDKEVATAKTKLDDLSKKLETALGDPKTSDADIAKYVDQISAQEAAVRKARLLGWHKARRILSTAQQKQVQDAAKKTKKKP